MKLLSRPHTERVPLRFRRLLPLLACLLVLPGPAYAVGRALPPPGAPWDYQIGGARAVGEDVAIVVRDRKARPAGRYDVCYVNGHQTQPDELAFWRQRPGLILRRDGRPVVDSAWGEQLLDVRTPAKRARLAAIVGGWMRGCADRGYEAVELDNLDAWTRSTGLIRRAETLAYARLLNERAHDLGLAVAQKNTPQLGGLGRRVGFDFAVAEECGRYAECGDYVATYGARVLAVEYRRADFDRACAQWGDRLGVLLRDLAVSPGGVTARC